MKIKTLMVILVVAVAAGAAGWLAGQRGEPMASSGPAGRKVLFYQSPMHPWIKSDKPGNCTICGMQLTPVYEGERTQEVDPNVVSLGSNSVTALGVKTEPVTRRGISKTIRLSGVVEDDASRRRIISAYVDGRIDQLAVNFLGAEVAEGELMASLYSPALLTAEREYLTLFRQRNETQNTPGGGAPEMLDAAGQRLRRLGLSEQQIKALPEKEANDFRTAILAPASGTVVARSVYEGQYVKEGEKLFEIADYSTMWGQFDVYEKDFAWIRPGQEVAVTTPGAPGRVFVSTVSFIEPSVTEMTRSAKARVELKNPLLEREGKHRRELVRNQYAEARAIVVGAPALAIPRGAVLQAGLEPVVFVEKGGGAYERRRVQLGLIGDDWVEALRGLAEGERVVTAGNMLIDSQAQLNRDASEAGPPSAEPRPEHTVPATSLSPEQKRSVQELLDRADALGQALAADNLANYNQAVPKFAEAARGLANALKGAADWEPRAAALQSSASAGEAGDLKTARAEFLPLSAAVVELTKAFRKAEGTAGPKIFRCPMFPKPGKSAFWIQKDGAIRNPFYGSAMLDCGNEVPP